MKIRILREQNRNKATSGLIFLLGMFASFASADDISTRKPSRRALDLVAGVSWDQPVGMKQPKPSLGNRLGFSVETPGLGVGKVGHLPVSLSLLYATRGTHSKDGFGRGTFSLLQFGLLGHGPIMGLPWLEAAAGFTPGYVLDLVDRRPDQSIVVYNSAVSNPITCDINIGMVVNLGVTQFRVMLYASPLANIENSKLTFSGFTGDFHLPLKVWQP